MSPPIFVTSSHLIALQYYKVLGSDPLSLCEIIKRTDAVICSIREPALGRAVKGDKGQK